MALIRTSGGASASQGVQKIISGGTTAAASTTIDITSYVSNYAACTADNFIVMPTRISTASASGNKDIPTPTYNASNGTLKVQYDDGTFYMVRYDVYYIPAGISN